MLSSSFTVLMHIYVHVTSDWEQAQGHMGGTGLTAAITAWQAAQSVIVTEWLYNKLVKL